MSSQGNSGGNANDPPEQPPTKRMKPNENVPSYSSSPPTQLNNQPDTNIQMDTTPPITPVVITPNPITIQQQTQLPLIPILNRVRLNTTQLPPKDNYSSDEVQHLYGLVIDGEHNTPDKPRLTLPLFDTWARRLPLPRYQSHSLQRFTTTSTYKQATTLQHLYDSAYERYAACYQGAPNVILIYITRRWLIIQETSFKLTKDTAKSCPLPDFTSTPAPPLDNWIADIKGDPFLRRTNPKMPKTVTLMEPPCFFTH